MGDSFERDRELGGRLREHCDPAPADQVDWERLRGSIAAAAAPELARLRASHASAVPGHAPAPAGAGPRLTLVPAQRGSRWRMSVYGPLAVAASVGLFLAVPGLLRDGGGGVDPAIMTAGGVGIEVILDGDLPESHIRALLAGAGNAEELLLLAASEDDAS